MELHSPSAHSDEPEYISHLKKHVPENWQDPREKVVRVLFEQSGIVPQMTERNPELAERLTDFFIHDRNILIVGGESGMGKSLMAADLRRMHKDLQLVLPPEHQSQLCVISWDRTHKAFFEEASTEIGETIQLPSGETHITARHIVSSILGDQIRFAQKYLGAQTKILVETPLIDTRGETLFHELRELKDQIQTLVMHSPETRYETLQQGRLMETSAQRDAMMAIREKLLYQIFGDTNIQLSEEEQDSVINNWWNQQVSQWNGLVVNWDPNDNRRGYQDSINLFKSTGVKPDILAPKSMSRFTHRQLESVLGTIRDVDYFIKTITSS